MDLLQWQSIRGVLIDLDGVLYVEESVIPGAVEALHFLNQKKIPFRYMTNTTVLPVDQLHQKLLRLGFPAQKDQIISPPRAAVDFLRRQGNPCCYLVMMEETQADFAEFRQTEDDPDYIVVGKIGSRWDYSLMNKLFRFMIGGAELIALHKDRCTMGVDGIHIEFGAFIAGLEYSTGKQALVLGKPSRDFFQTAIHDLEVSQEQIVMIGDDLVSDVQGAQNAGIKGVLVRTGKYHEDRVACSVIRPDAEIASISDLPRLFTE